MKMREADYKTLLENVDGLVVVDRDGIILMMEDALAKTCYVNGEQMDKEKAVGRNIMDVIPTTHIMDCFEQPSPKVADYYFVDGRTIVSTRKPIIRDSEIVAVMEYDLFGVEGEHLTEFIQKTSELSKNLSVLKDDYFSSQRSKYTINSIIGNSNKINKVKEEIKIASRYNSTVLIEGETGTGKELVAHAIHSLSDRQLAAFIKINCSAIPESLIESELFGYEDGSFTGGKKGGRKGKIEMANGGTIFLDEINQLPLSAQPKLLRTLQEHEVNPVGSEKNIPVDIRVVAASNENLKTMVAEGRFREDLYYRLNVINIKVPSLEKRKDDIPYIVENTIKRLNKQLDKEIKGISPEAIRVLKRYHWPGNIRELNNVIERAMSHCEENTLKLIHFTDSFMYEYQKKKDAFTLQEGETLHEIRQRAERKAIVEALATYKGNKVKAAKALNISRSLIHKKINSLNITEDEY